MPTDTITEYGSIGLTPEQEANEAAAQITRYSTGTEPAALSSSSGADNFQSNIDPVITSANEAITQADQTKKDQETASSTSDKTTPPDPTADPVAAAEAAYLADLERQQKEAEDTYAALTAAATKSAKESIKVLTGSYKERRKLLEESNRQSQASWKQQFLRFGQAEYSPGMTADFMGQKEREGMATLTKLDNDYRAQVASINAAKDEGLYAIAAEKTKQLNSLTEKVNAQILANAKEAEEANDKLKESIIKTSRENTIVSLIKQYGITDPADIQNLTNFDDAGNATGDITLEEIDKVLKIMGLDAKSEMAGLSADYKTYNAMKKNGELSKDWSYTDYLAAVSAAKRAPKAGKSTTPGSDIVTDPDTETLVSYEEWYPEFLKTAEGQQIAEGLGGDNISLAKNLRKMYSDATMAYYRDNPSSTKKFTASNVPTPLRENLIADINNDFSLNDLIAAYPDLSSSYITSTYNSLKKKKEDEEESTLSTEDFLKELRGEE